MNSQPSPEGISPSLDRAPTPSPDPSGAPEPGSPGQPRSVAVSYGLWCLALLGLCGLHRIYNRQRRLGLLWLFTFGLCGIGQLADLALIPAMVKDPPPASPDDDRTPALENGLLPPLDLLRERRQELKLEPLSGVLMLQPLLVRRGLTIGGLALGLSVGLCALLLLYHQYLKARVGQLERYELEATQLKQSLATQGAALKRLRGGNEQLVKRLSDVRSSSALLADLQLRVPEGVQLTKVQMATPTDLRLEGVARDPVAFGRVNAMELVLRRSPLFLATGVTIAKVERRPKEEVTVKVNTGLKGAEETKQVELPGSVTFQMSATLSPLAPTELVAVMGGLKAEGMARRLELLQREGLLK